MPRPAASGSVIASIPSPEQGVWTLGPFPVRAYALCIIVGIVVGGLHRRPPLAGPRRIGRHRRRHRRCGRCRSASSAAGSTTSSPRRSAYFGEGGDPIAAVKVWEGGLGIWGAIALGAVGAWIGCRRRGIALPPLADAVAPGVAVAQAIGRWGNWFNVRSCSAGRPSCPGGWRSPPTSGRRGSRSSPPSTRRSCTSRCGAWAWPGWSSGPTAGSGSGTAGSSLCTSLLYVVGRAWWESLRIDEANEILGLRVNFWMSLIVGLAALAYLVISARVRPGREEVVEPRSLTPAGGSTDRPANG